MSSYEAAQARLADAKRRRDSRSIHAAVEESKRLLTHGLREKFRPELPAQEPPAPPKRPGRLTAYVQRLIGGVL
jgi:hypothetical protein